MSYSISPLTPVLIQDPLLIVDAVHQYGVIQGANQILAKSYVSTNISSSSISFSCPPPSCNSAVDRKNIFQLPIRLTINGLVSTNNGAYTPSTQLLNAGLDAPRAFPVSSSLDTVQVTINSQSVSINMSDMIQALLRYDTDNSLTTTDYSMTPSYLDESQNYNDLIGTARNPLGNWANTAKNDGEERGGFPFTIVAGTNAAVTPTTGAGTAASAVVDFVATELLFLSPLLWGQKDQQAFYNVINMDYTFNFVNTGARFWSHSPVVSVSGSNIVTSTITSITASFNNFSPAFSYAQNIPTLFFKYLTPNLLTKQMLNANTVLTYPYSDLTRYVTDIGALAFGAPQQFATNTVTLSSIPRKIYVYGRPNNATLLARPDITDSYLAISNVSIQWGNSATQMATFSQQQLYLMNIRNGYQGTWSEFTGLSQYNNAFPGVAGSAKYGTCCGPLCIMPGFDLYLEEGQCAGQNGQFQLQVNVTLQNMNPSGAWDVLPMSIYVIVVNEGSFTIPSCGAALANLGVVSKMDVIDAQSKPGISYNSARAIRGSGDFLSGLSHFASKVNDFLKEHKLISSIGKSFPHPIAQAVGHAAEVLGYGDGMHGAVAGKRMSKAALRRNLLEYR